MPPANYSPILIHCSLREFLLLHSYGNLPWSPDQADPYPYSILSFSHVLFCDNT